MTLMNHSSSLHNTTSTARDMFQPICSEIGTTIKQPGGSPCYCVAVEVVSSCSYRPPDCAFLFTVMVMVVQSKSLGTLLLLKNLARYTHLSKVLHPINVLYNRHSNPGSVVSKFIVSQARPHPI